MNGRIGNLRPWPKGVSGNPGGRPRKLLAEKLLRKLLENDEAEAHNVIAAIIEKAKAGDVSAFNSIRDMVDGKPAQAIEHAGADGGETPTCIRVRFVAPDNVEKP